MEHVRIRVRGFHLFVFLRVLKIRVSFVILLFKDILGL